MDLVKPCTLQNWVFQSSFFLNALVDRIYHYVQALKSHYYSGYRFPWMPLFNGAPKFHDDHHRLFKYNYGTLGVLDYIHGTLAPWKNKNSIYAFIFKLNNILLFGGTPNLDKCRHNLLGLSDLIEFDKFSYFMYKNHDLWLEMKQKGLKLTWEQISRFLSLANSLDKYRKTPIWRRGNWSVNL